MKNDGTQQLLQDMLPLAEKIAQYLSLHANIGRVVVAGGVRRRQQVQRELDIVVEIAQFDRDTFDFIGAMPGVAGVIVQTDYLVSVQLSIGLPLNLRIAVPADFFAVLYYYTAAPAPNQQLANVAHRQGFIWNQQGLTNAAGEKIVLANEEQLCSLLAMDYIAPELREGRNEVLQATGHALPRLLVTDDLKGVLHVHSNYSDGSDNLVALRAGARRRGWHYLGISDHSQSAYYAGGLGVEAVMAQRREIDDLNAECPDFTILAGIESDIQTDGSLDYSDDILSSFDFVVASVHSGFKQNEKTMTKRIIRAMSNRNVTMLGHPTGRLLLKRQAYQLDLQAVIVAAGQTGTMIEINANPRRLDLDWRWCQQACSTGVVLAVNPDAHSVAELDYVDFGVAMARKAGLRAEDILNTRNLAELRIMLNCKK